MVWPAITCIVVVIVGTICGVVWGCVRASVCACVRACVRVCVCVHACGVGLPVHPSGAICVSELLVLVLPLQTSSCGWHVQTVFIA